MGWTISISNLTYQMALWLKEFVSVIIFFAPLLYNIILMAMDITYPSFLNIIGMLETPGNHVIDPIWEVYLICWGLLHCLETISSKITLKMTHGNLIIMRRTLTIERISMMKWGSRWKVMKSNTLGPLYVYLLCRLL
jgi:hypothetical protein